MKLTNTHNLEIMKNTKKLEKIVKKYEGVDYKSNNYEIGGGLYANNNVSIYEALPEVKAGSNRFVNASEDVGKLTLSEANQIFKKATGMGVEVIREIIKKNLPNMEWHHSSRMNKGFGAGMRKQFFVNSKEMVFLAKNWFDLVKKFEVSKVDEKVDEKFLKKFATKVTRVAEVPELFYQTTEEMCGRRGWFCSVGKDYNLERYVTGWVFKSKKSYLKFKSL